MAQHPPSDSTPFVELMGKILKSLQRNDSWLQQQTTKMAEKIAKDNPTYDELCWLSAEADLDLRNIAPLYMEKKLTNLSLVPPTEANIKMLAEAISSYHNTLNDLHWQLAERKILLENLKKA